MGSLVIPLRGGKEARFEGTAEEMLVILSGIREPQGRPELEIGLDKVCVGWTPRSLQSFETHMSGLTRQAWERIKRNGTEWTPSEEISEICGVRGRQLGSVFGGFRLAARRAGINLPLPIQKNRKRHSRNYCSFRYRLSLEALLLLDMPSEG